MSLRGIIHIAIATILPFGMIACAQEYYYNPRGYVCYQTDAPLSIDGKSDEKAWQSASWTADFVDIEGDAKPAPLYRTRAKMLWDEQYFYILAEITEPDIWATYAQHDMVIFHENDFEVFIDPDGDTHNYYEFEVNALGTYWDLMLIKPYLNGGPPINAWDIKGLKSAIDIQGTINNPSDKDRLWTVELAFPWEVLKQAAFEVRKPQDGEQWRLNFSRVNWRTEAKEGKYVKQTNPETGAAYPEYNWVWSPQGTINMHLPEMWGFVQFSTSIAGSGTVKFVPDPEDEVKWLLRNIYYAEKEYQKEHGSFTNDIQELPLSGNLKNQLDEQPQIQTTDSLFEIIYPAKAEGMKWHIRDDGKIWKTSKKLSKHEITIKPGHTNQ